MSIMVRCSSCGTTIGDVMLAFLEIRAYELDKAIGGIDKFKNNVNPNFNMINVKIDMDSVLKELHIDKICCRTHIIGCVIDNECIANDIIKK